jgi:hypothetical protein
MAHQPLRTGLIAATEKGDELLFIEAANQKICLPSASHACMPAQCIACMYAKEV